MLSHVHTVTDPDNIFPSTSAWCIRLVQFCELPRVEIWSIKLVEEITLSQYCHRYVEALKCIQMYCDNFLEYLCEKFCTKYMYMCEWF